MLASHESARNQIFVASWIIIIVGAFFAYFDIFPPGVKRVFAYVWLVGVAVQLIFGLYWTIDKYRNKEFLVQRSRRKKKSL